MFFKDIDSLLLKKRFIMIKFISVFFFMTLLQSENEQRFRSFSEDAQRGHLGAYMFLSRTTYSWEDPLTFIVSTPRSGLHWLVYSINHLNERPILFGGLLNNALKLYYDPDETPIIAVHQFREFMDSKLDKLIVLTRSPRESILRNLGPQKSEYLDVIDKLDRAFISQKNGNSLPFEICISQLQIYDAWNPEKRLLIYYEDLMTAPSKVLTKIMCFLEEKNWDIMGYLKDIEYHKKNCKDRYLSKWYGSVFSNGVNIKPYSTKLSLEELEELDYKIRLLDPEIYDKYCIEK